MKRYALDGRKNFIGERARKVRESMELSQEQVAAQMEIMHVVINGNAISLIEAGERFVSDFEALYLAKVLKVDLMWLLTGEEHS